MNVGDFHYHLMDVFTIDYPLCNGRCARLGLPTGQIAPSSCEVYSLEAKRRLVYVRKFNHDYNEIKGVLKRRDLLRDSGYQTEALSPGNRCVNLVAGR